MKKPALLLLLIAPLAISAQKKVDLDKFNFTAQYRALPQVQIDTTYHTYNVEVEGTQIMKSYLQELQPEESVELEGWRKLRSNGHITIKVKVDDLLPESVSIKERIENTKNKAGAIIGTKIFYSQEVIYSFAATAIITDYKGSHLTDVVLDTRSYKKTYTGPEFPIKEIAAGYFLANSFKLTRELYRKSLNTSLHYLSSRISTDYGYRAVNVKDHMWIVDSKKHPEYNAHRKAFLALNDIFFRMDANTPIDNIRKEAQPVIAYFESIKKRYSSSSKHDRKIRYASYFNLAVLYYYLDDPQMMMKEASGLVLNDFDSKDGKGFEQTAIWLKDLFDQTNRNTRHFPIDIQSFRGPYEKKYYDNARSL